MPTTRTLGVCSWSLQPATARQLADRVTQTGLSSVSLALDPIRRGDWSLDDTRRALADAGLSLASGMMEAKGEDYSSLEAIERTGGLRPDEHWEDNLAAAHANADIAHTLGLSLVTLHAGFLPAHPDHPEHATLTDRLAKVAAAFGERGVAVALETGQETADTLLAFLAQPRLAGVGVNFDPANMILYAKGDPIDAMTRLAPHIFQLHMKEAVATSVPGQWGTEVRAGEGQVDWPRYFEILSTLPPEVSVMIEREAGDDRVADIIAARDLASAHM
ncbi:MAG: sugar phosphate isomerase/epimerase family protein [Phycisphaerales bacterium JB040]